MGRNTGGMGGADIAFNFLRGAEAIGQGMRRSQQLESEGMALEDERGVRAAYEQIAQAVGPTGDISALDGNPLLNTRYGTMAAGKFFADRASTETSRLQMLQNMGKADDTFYQITFRPLAMAAQEAYQAGDMERFGGIINELSAKSPLPYRYQYNPGENSFAESFRSSKDGGWVDTPDTLTPEQAKQALDGIMSGEQRVLAGANMGLRNVNQRFLAMAARYKMGTILDNANALADPKRWIPLNKGGRTIWVVPQNRHDDYSAGPSYRIVDDSGAMGGMVGSLDGLLGQGWTRADVAADLANKRRLAAGSRGGNGLGTSPMDQMMIDALLQNGYDYDKKYNRWFKTTIDENGKRQIDYTQPLTPAEYEAIKGKLASGDPLGILGGGAVAEPVPSGSVGGVKQALGNAQGALGLWTPTRPEPPAKAADGPSWTGDPRFEGYRDTVDGTIEIGKTLARWFRPSDYTEPEDPWMYRP